VAVGAGVVLYVVQPASEDAAIININNAFFMFFSFLIRNITY
jgi:hypothetical protein